MVPFITSEFAFRQYVCELVLVSTYLSICLRVGFLRDVLDLDFGVQIDSIEQPIQAQLCGFWKHVFIVGLLPLMIILITASMSFKHIQQSFLKYHLGYRFVVFKNVEHRTELRRLCVCGNVIHIE